MSTFRIPKKNRGGPAKGNGGGGGRGSGGRGRGFNGGGGRGGKSFYDGRMRAFGTDRFCTACGTAIIGLATTMEGICPHCEEKVPFIHPFDQEFDANGWGRCRNCKSFMNRKMVYCQACQCVNVVGKERIDRLKRQQLMSDRARMQKVNEEKDAKIARLEAANLELNQVVGLHEKRLSEGARTGLNAVDEMESDDDVLSQIDESSIVMPKNTANDGPSKISAKTASNNDSDVAGSSASSLVGVKSPNGDKTAYNSTGSRTDEESIVGASAAASGSSKEVQPPEGN